MADNYKCFIYFSEQDRIGSTVGRWLMISSLGVQI